MSLALLIDFGSTYTKLRAVDLADGTLLAGVQSPSTVATDITLGLERALTRLAAMLPGHPRFSLRLASSSAAGGLRMVTVGLVRELTAEAARRAALGAGAKVVGSHAYRLTVGDLHAIEGAAPDILLLCGGTDGGNAEVVLHNAHALARAKLRCDVVVACNRDVADEVAQVLRDAGQPVRVVDNVMPSLGVLDPEPVQAAIRDVFIQRIVHAKGIDRARGHVDAVLMPTPSAVLAAAQMLSVMDTSRLPCQVVVVDPGGATTDVHSVGDGAPLDGTVVRLGLPEPHAKRTVEGDLGMRHGAATVAQAVGVESLAADAELPVADVAARIAALVSRPELVPDDDPGRRLDNAIARQALRLAVERHAGRLETVHTLHGPAQVQYGKDLRGFDQLIGTGGVVAATPRPAGLLRACLAGAHASPLLLPRRPRLRADPHYVLYAAGLLAEAHPNAARWLLQRHLPEVE